MGEPIVDLPHGQPAPGPKDPAPKSSAPSGVTLTAPDFPNIPPVNVNVNDYTSKPDHKSDRGKDPEEIQIEKPMLAKRMDTAVGRALGKLEAWNMENMKIAKPSKARDFIRKLGLGFLLTGTSAGTADIVAGFNKPLADAVGMTLANPSLAIPINQGIGILNQLTTTGDKLRTVAEMTGGALSKVDILSPALIGGFAQLGTNIVRACLGERDIGALARNLMKKGAGKTGIALEWMKKFVLGDRSSIDSIMHLKELSDQGMLAVENLGEKTVKGLARAAFYADTKWKKLMTTLPDAMNYMTARDREYMLKSKVVSETMQEWLGKYLKSPGEIGEFMDDFYRRSKIRDAWSQVKIYGKEVLGTALKSGIFGGAVSLVTGLAKADIFGSWGRWGADNLRRGVEYTTSAAAKTAGGVLNTGIGTVPHGGLGTWLSELGRNFNLGLNPMVPAAVPAVVTPFSGVAAVRQIGG
jgi:hypothetical protein